MACEDTSIRRLILASGSPRRRQLVSLLGLPFVIKQADLDERRLDGETPCAFVLRVSRAKAYAVQGIRRDELVIAADTIVVLGDEVLGKPATPLEASLMLQRLRGEPHKVYTGLAVWNPSLDVTLTEIGESTVWMRDYSSQEIADYVASGDPLDKAGAYAIQHAEFDPVSRVEGCWLNVMGLPLCQLARALSSLGVAVPPDVPGTCQAFNQRVCSVAFELLAGA